jgi:hypothetical protein
MNPLWKNISRYPLWFLRFWRYIRTYLESSSRIQSQCRHQRNLSNRASCKHWWSAVPTLWALLLLHLCPFTNSCQGSGGRRDQGLSECSSLRYTFSQHLRSVSELTGQGDLPGIRSVLQRPLVLWRRLRSHYERRIIRRGGQQPRCVFYIIAVLFTLQLTFRIQAVSESTHVTVAVQLIIVKYSREKSWGFPIFICTRDQPGTWCRFSPRSDFMVWSRSFL